MPQRGGGGSEAEANCCRVYACSAGGLRGVPDEEEVIAALRADAAAVGSGGEAASPGSGSAET